MIRRIASRAEELGYASLWTFQRVLSPSAPSSARRTTRCWTRSSRSRYVAGHTERIRLGTATVCAPFTAPALLAKAMTTLDVLCSGRLTVGLGMGWLPEEYAAAGVPFERRGAGWTSTCAASRRCGRRTQSVRRRVLAGAALARGRGPYSGRTRPVLLGGAAAPALRRTGRLTQAGSPAASTTYRVSARRSRPCARARARPKDPDALRIVVRRHPASELDLAALARAGVTEVLLDLNFQPGLTSSTRSACSTHWARERIDVARPPSSAGSPC